MMNFSSNKFEKKIYTIEQIKDKMAKYCLYQDRCHWEVENKLKDFNLIPEAREEILFKLINYGFLNEERFVYSFIRGKTNQKLWGRNRIRQELKLRRIDLKLIEKALKEEIDEEIYWTNLLKLKNKKINSLQSEKDSYKKLNKVKTYLVYKGYEYDLIEDVLKFEENKKLEL